MTKKMVIGLHQLFQTRNAKHQGVVNGRDQRNLIQNIRANGGSQFFLLFIWRSAPKIPNPDYKGEWKAKTIPNPNYTEDLHRIIFIQLD